MQRWFDDFVKQSLQDAEVDVFVRAVDDEIVAAIPQIAEDPGLIAELHASTRAHWRNFLVALGDEYRLALPSAAVALAESIARRGMDIDVLLRVYRVAHRAVFRYFVTATEGDQLPAEVARDEVLIHLWTRAERWIDDSVDALIETFAAERNKLQEGARARRAELIESLVTGADPGPEAEHVLGHALSQWQTGFVLWGGEADGDGASRPLAEVATRACHRLGLPNPVTKLAGSRELWGWVATVEPPTLDAGAVVDLLEEHGLRLALGRPEKGAAGFRTSHLQALAAQRLGRPAAGSLFDYDDLELLCLLGDTDLVQIMVRREIGPLLGEQKNLQALRETVLEFLRNGRDVDAVAAALYVHPNTVRYRLTRAEELLGGGAIVKRAARLEICLQWVTLYEVPPPG